MAVTHKIFYVINSLNISITFNESYTVLFESCILTLCCQKKETDYSGLVIIPLDHVFYPLLVKPIFKVLRKRLLGVKNVPSAMIENR